MLRVLILFASALLLVGIAIPLIAYTSEDSCALEVRYAEEMRAAYLQSNGSLGYEDVVPKDHPDRDMLDELYHFSFNFGVDDFVPAVRERCRARESVQQSLGGS